MPHRDYSHRDVIDKLGIKPGTAMLLAEDAFPLNPDLRERAVARAGRALAGDGEPAGVVLATAGTDTDTIALLIHYKARIQPAGGIWLLTPKRGRPGYLDQRRLIDAGTAAGLVDNKVCSVSETVSAMRFVVRRADRRAATST